MVNNRKAQIIFRSIYLIFALVGVVASFGVFDGVYNKYWYLFFTNISNYLSFFTILALLIYTVRDYKNGEKRGLTSQAPIFRFSVAIMMIITFAVYNILLSNPFSGAYWMNWQSLIVHLVCPVMFVVDYMIFSEHRKLGVLAPLCAVILPCIYVVVILSRAEVVLGSGELVYPYFFLDAHSLGYGVVALALLAILAVILGLGYLLWAYDKLVKNEEGKLKWDFSPLPKPAKEEELDEDTQSDDPEDNITDDSLDDAK